MIKHLILASLFLIPNLAKSQMKKNKVTVPRALESYFQQRQSIHLHLSKDSYYTGESIWFSAYLFNLTSGQLSTTSTNLNVVLMDENGNELSKILLIAKNGRAQGEFLINPKQSGKVLYLKSYTAAMNGHYEDNSFVTSVALIGNELVENTASTAKMPDVQILPEGGYALLNVVNNYGIKIINPDGLGAEINDIELLDSSGNALLEGIQTNRYGMGKFVFTPKVKSGYKLRLNYKGKVVEQELPDSYARGIGLRINQNFTNGDAEATVYTNQQSLPFIQNDSLQLVVHKGTKSQSYYLKFEAGYNELKLSLPKDKLYDGVNTITLFNSTNEPLLERLIFNKLKPLPLNIADNISIQNEADTTVVKLNLSIGGNTAALSASISILPAQTVATEQLASIYASSEITPFIKGQFEQPNYYFTAPSAQKRYALDLVLLNQGWSKYRWRNIFNYQNDRDYFYNGPGIGIKGYLRSTEKAKPAQVLFYSKENEQAQYVPVAQDGKFSVENISADVGSTFELTAIDEQGKPVDCQFFYTILPTNKDLENPFGLQTLSPFEKYSPDDTNYADGSDKEAEKLEEVVVVAPKLKYEKYFKGWDARLIDKREKSRGILANFVMSYGYYRIGGAVAKRVVTPTGSSVVVYPRVSVNGVNLPGSFAMEVLNMKDVAEIYVDRPLRSITDPTGFAHRTHTFIVFTEEGFSFSGPDKRTAKRFTLTDKGTTPIKEYYQPLYDYRSESFKALGSFGWVPDISPDANGEIELRYTNPLKEDSLLIIQGVDENGYPFSTTAQLAVDKAD